MPEKCDHSHKLNDNKKINQANLDPAIMGTLGMYKEAIDLLSKKLIVDTPELKRTITVLTAFMGTCQTTPVQNMKNKYRTLVEK
jgi:hypothetical protein